MTHAAERSRYDGLALPGTSEYESAHAALFARGGRIEGTNVFEPIHDGYRASAAAPLDLSTDEACRGQQDIRTMLGELILSELRGVVSDEIAGFTARSIFARMAEREGANGGILQRRLHETPLLVANDEVRNAEILRACEAADNGTATMRQAYDAMRSRGHASGEFGNITVIKDKRSEHLDEMEHETKQLMGADYQPTDYRVSIDTFDRDPGAPGNHHLGAVRIKAKRQFGTLQSGPLVKERTFVIVDLSRNGGVDQEIVDEIIEAHRREQQQEIERKISRHTLKISMDENEILERLRHPAEEVSCESKGVDYSQLPHLQHMLDWLVQNEFRGNQVLARNTTIYGYDARVDAALRAQQAAENEKLFTAQMSLPHADLKKSLYT